MSHNKWFGIWDNIIVHLKQNIKSLALFYIGDYTHW